ncbi:hypothetical protein [Butyrivibrio proteoclasticus]|uniref:hypothetical protein n=1 Tax=Butyrivibrio proteoclasticus TaxID=43305 RepID=UPI00047D10AD|nr:hypothetical protein [Butyrivibrio proteoclasticus]
MKKRLLPVLIALVLLTGCGNEGNTADQAVSNVTQSAEVVAEASLDTGKDLETDNANKNLGSEADKQIESDHSNEGKTTDKKVASDSNSDKDSNLNSDNKADKSSEDSSADASEQSLQLEPQQETEQATSQDTPQVVPQKPDYGRIIFTGDSRTVDMFYSDRNEIWGESFDGIPVYCRDACQSDYMINAVNSYGMDNFDTLVTWMGCNDYGNFSSYESFYNNLLQQGKNIVVCTVGPTDNNTLANDFDREYYTNERQIAYNSSLISWANSNNVKIIDLYTYISGNSNLYINPEDGIHYMPQPTTEIWNYILAQIR